MVRPWVAAGRPRRDALHDLADEVRADVGSLGVDAAADAAEHAEERLIVLSRLAEQGDPGHLMDRERGKGSGVRRSVVDWQLSSRRTGPRARTFLKSQ